MNQIALNDAHVVITSRIDDRDVTIEGDVHDCRIEVESDDDYQPYQHARLATARHYMLVFKTDNVHPAFTITTHEQEKDEPCDTAEPTLSDHEMGRQEGYSQGYAAAREETALKIMRAVING